MWQSLRSSSSRRLLLCRLAYITAATLFAFLLATSWLRTSSQHRLYHVSGSASVPATPWQPVRILAAGDSITWGLGSSTGTGYRLALERILEEHGYRVIYIGNVRSGDMDYNLHEGHPNATIKDLHEKLKITLPQMTPADLILLHIGTNNIGHGGTVPDMRQDLFTLLGLIQHLWPSTSIVVSHIIGCACNLDFPRTIKEYNTVVSALPGLFIGLTVVEQGNVDLWHGDGSDVVHPNDIGYQKMAQNFAVGVLEAIQGPITSEKQ